MGITANKKEYWNRERRGIFWEEDDINGKKKESRDWFIVTTPKNPRRVEELVLVGRRLSRILCSGRGFGIISKVQGHHFR